MCVCVCVCNHSNLKQIKLFYLNEIESYSILKLCIIYFTIIQKQEITEVETMINSK